MGELEAGLRHEQLGALEAAVACYRAALAKDATRVDAHVNLAGVLWRIGGFDAALEHAREAVRLAPASAPAQRILGTTLLHLNRVDEAERALLQALRLQPGLVSAQADLAFTLLLAGRLAEGWRAYEQRRRDPGLQRPAFWRAEREWPGPSASLQGRTIAVYGEQGRGDMLQFMRYLPRLQALGARVQGVFAPDLRALVQASFPAVPCVDAAPGLRCDWHVALMDLPGRFGTTLANVPADVPYLHAPADRRATWSARLQPWRDRPRVGFAWCGSPVQVNNRNRSLRVSALLPLLAVQGPRFFCLQREKDPAWSDAALPAPVVDLTADWRDLADSAAMIEHLDLVVTVDSAVAHLAGALGKPVWILLPPNADWRWLLRRCDSPWYPGARLFRRAHREAPAAQVARVANALRQWLAQDEAVSSATSAALPFRP